MMKYWILLWLLFVPEVFAASGEDIYRAEIVAKDIKVAITTSTSDGQHYFWYRATRENGALTVYTCGYMALNQWAVAAGALNTTTLDKAIYVPVPDAPMPWIWTNRMSSPANAPAWCLQ